MSDTSMEVRWSDSYLSAGSEYLETLYEAYLSNAQDLPEQWRSYFQSLPSVGQDVSLEQVKARFLNIKSTVVPVAQNDKQGLVEQLIESYRLRNLQLSDND